MLLKVLNNDNGNGKDIAQKQRSDWLQDEK